MVTRQQKILEQSVIEFTEMMRRGEAFKGVLRLIIQKGLDPQTVYLTDHYEDEEGRELGVIVAEDGACYEFRQHAYTKDPNPKWVRVRKKERLYDRYEHVRAAVEMVSRLANS